VVSARIKPDAREADIADMPRLTRRVFRDLAIWMVALGLATGIVFPFFVIPLGVSTDTALTASFFAACCAAGLLVGGLNFVLVRAVVHNRLRLLADGMRDAAEKLQEADKNGGSMKAGGTEGSRLPVDSEDELGESAAAFNRLADALAESRHALATRGATDPLTGLANRRAFQERLRAEVKRARRYGSPLALAILDLDRFKRVNETYGHEVGDRVLTEVARRLTTITRAGELVARMGGEEFAWILPETEGTAAQQAGERLRAAFAREPFPVVGDVTVSIGVCDLEHAGDASQLCQHADRALYWAKAHGRNVCVLHPAALPDQARRDQHPAASRL
jgi:diguanylate cyclase (GGDEF)-like protein